MPSAYQQSRQYFRRAYETGSHGWETVEPSLYVAPNLAIVARRTAGRRLLEMGCGEGRHCLIAARMGFLPTEVGNEPSAIRRARAFAQADGLADQVQWVLAVVLALP